MNKIKYLIICICLVLGCGNGETPPGSNDQNSTPIHFSSQIEPILSSHCTGCHVTGGQASFLPLTSDIAYQNLTTLKSYLSNEALVTPGNADTSVMYLRVSGTSVGSQMPLGGPYLDSNDQDLIYQWIEDGALE